jgi:hypothetical protein
VSATETDMRTSGGETAAIVFQRRADAWLNQVRDEAAEAGVSPFDYDGLRLDPLDAMRLQLNIENGSLLASDGKSLDGVRGVRERLAGWMYYLRRRIGVPRLHVAAGARTAWLALPRQPAHLSDMLPVARHLRVTQSVETVFGVCDRRMVARIRDEGFGVFGLYSGGRLAEIAARPIIRRYRSDLGRLLERMTPALEASRHRALAENTERIVGELLGEVLSTASAVRRALLRIRPRGVLVGNPYVFEGAVACRTAAAHGVPAATIEHGSIFPDDPSWRHCPVDLVCTWGEPSRRALEACGVPVERIRVTGAPRHDEIFLKARQFDLPRDERPFILVAIGGPGDNVSLEQHRRFIRILYAAADAAPSVRWVVKLHKRDRMEHYPPPGAGPHPRITVVPNDFARDGLNIFDYLAKARAVVTILSTVASEAMALGLPVISVDIWHPGRSIQGIEFLDRECTRRVRTAEELARAAEYAWRGDPNPEVDGEAERYAREHFVNRGRAAEAAADALTALVGSPETGA